MKAVVLLLLACPLAAGLCIAAPNGSHSKDKPGQPGEQERSELVALSESMAPFFSELSHGKLVDWKVVLDRIRAFAAKYPESGNPFDILRGVMYAYEAHHTPAEALEAWTPFEGSPNEDVAEAARRKSALFSALKDPVDLKFTALDGKTVDLKKLRGKVVLLDFWATWSDESAAELPNVVKAYTAWHDKGFEIVGVACDLAPDPSVKSEWEGKARSRPAVLEYTRKNGMPWPEKYEGGLEDRDSFSERFAVTELPANFLIGADGRVVAMNLLGDALDAALKKML